MQWRSRNADPVALDALHEGVPPWLRVPLLKWAATVTTATYQNEYWETKQANNVELLEEYETATRAVNTRLVEFRQKGVLGLFEVMDAEEFLDFVDFLVYKQGASDFEGIKALRALEAILADAGSAWRVGKRNGHAALEQRVPEGVAEAIDSIAQLPGHAGALLAEAWNAGFGRAPDSEKAYAKAIKAVEAAAIPLVSPSNKAATLGTVLAQMKQQGNWGLEMSREHNEYPTRQALIGMMQTLWTGQNDRHAGQPGYASSTPREAEAAVLLAVPLVQWFSSGAIARR